MSNGILIACSDEDVLAFLSNLFDVLVGVRTVSARDGVVALQKAREYRPSLIILDLVLPRLDGIELATRLRADSATRGIPMIALTASPAARERALAAGCDAFVQKPFDIDRSLSTALRYLDTGVARPA